MRYRFRGLARTTGQRLEGHVEASSEASAFDALSDNGIVTESLYPDPKAESRQERPDPRQESRHDVRSDSGGPLESAHPKFGDAIDSALDVASTQIPFDKLVDRFKGKSVWVIDREKIRRNVSDVVDKAMKESLKNSDSEVETRKKVAQAIDGLFKDNKNITSQQNQVNASLEKQIARLEKFIMKAEAVLAAISGAVRSGGSFNFGESSSGPRRTAVAAPVGGGGNSALLEIFKDNLRLRGIQIDEVATASANAAPAQAAGNGPKKPTPVPPNPGAA